jgi:hypothetical protein
MKSPRIEIWKLKDAPNELKLLYSEPGTPEWVALVPRTLSGPDLDQVMTGNAGGARVSRYTLQNGDIVYVGTPLFAEVLPESGRPKSARLSSR